MLAHCWDPSGSRSSPAPVQIYPRRVLTNATRTCRIRFTVAATWSSFPPAPTAQSGTSYGQKSWSHRRCVAGRNSTHRDERYESDIGCGALRLHSPRAPDDLRSSASRLRAKAELRLTEVPISQSLKMAPPTYHVVRQPGLPLVPPQGQARQIRRRVIE